MLSGLLKRTVIKIAPGEAVTDEHNNVSHLPGEEEVVRVAGWSEPDDESRARFTAPHHYSYLLDLHAESGVVALGDRIKIDGEVYLVLGRTSYNNGPFNWTPGLDLIRLGRKSG